MIKQGRPLKFKSVKQLQEKIDAYFEWCDTHPLKGVHTSRIDDKTGKPLTYDIDRPYTIEGLCTFLECDRDTLLNYEKTEGYEDFFGTIKNAKIKIQQDKVEKGLTGLAPASTTIFDLKNNHGYKDKSESEVDVKSSDGSMTPRTMDEFYNAARGND